MLERDVHKRMGSIRGIEEIKKHPFFATLDFDLIVQKQIPAPFTPNLSGQTDVQYFDDEFTSENIAESYMPQTSIDYIKKNANKFADFNN